jgi:hypothetical protein
MHLSNSPIAQSVERRTVNPQVPGSSPGRGAKESRTYSSYPRAIYPFWDTCGTPPFSTCSEHTCTFRFGGRQAVLMPSTENVKQKKCGLIMPISAIDGYLASHWEAVFSIIKEALSATEFSVELVSDSDEIGVIQKRIVQNVYDNEIIVCDVSAKNPNVMFELGMRLAFDKPAIIIKDDKTNYSFDTAPIEHLEYPLDLNCLKIQAFKLKLRDKVVATHQASERPDYTTFLKHFGNFVIADIEEKKVDKDGYLLEAVSELRKEVLALARRFEGGRNALQLSTSPTYRLKQYLKQQQIDEEAEDAMLQFAREYLGSMTSTERTALMQSTDSAEFTKMVHAYMKSKYLIRLDWNLSELKTALYFVIDKYLNAA